VIDKEMDIVELLITVRQIKTFIQKNFIDWKKMKNEVPKDEAKRVINLDAEKDDKIVNRVKNKKINELQTTRKDFGLEMQPMAHIVEKEIDPPQNYKISKIKAYTS
jgi:uncharacterized membrane protein (DUF106 family)